MHLYLQKVLISLTGPVFSKFFLLKNHSKKNGFSRWRQKFKMTEKEFNFRILLPICFYIKNSLLHAFIFTKNSDFLDGPCEKTGCTSLQYGFLELLFYQGRGLSEPESYSFEQPKKKLNFSFGYFFYNMKKNGTKTNKKTIFFLNVSRKNFFSRIFPG